MENFVLKTEPDVLVDTSPTTSKEGFFANFFKKYEENRLYVYIGIGVVVLGIVLYYFYVKNKQETNIQKKTGVTPQTILEMMQNMPLPMVQQILQQIPPQLLHETLQMHQQLMQQQMQQQAPQQMQQQQMQQPMQQQMQQPMQQPMQQQPMYQQASQQTKPTKKSRSKLQHPNMKPELNTDNINNLDDVDVEVARAQLNENENVAEYNLTNSEVQDIHNKLDKLKDI